MNAIASTAMSEPPCLRFHSLRRQRYSARVAYCSGWGRVLGIWH